jgi:ribosome biogenesis SPOUT family RNA methylase Rps3
MTDPQKIYIVEHLDPELESWSSLEYASIARESHAAHSKFYLTSVPTTLKLPQNLQGIEGLNVENQSVEELFKEKKSKVCLLDPSASVELSPEDGDVFEIFLFGGILGMLPPLQLKECTMRREANFQLINRRRSSTRLDISIGFSTLPHLITQSRPHFRAPREGFHRPAFGTRSNDHGYCSPSHSNSCPRQDIT